jgi:hypothetical protein
MPNINNGVWLVLGILGIIALLIFILPHFN